MTSPLSEPCFLCGAPALRRELIVTGQTAVSHSPWHGDQQTHTDHATSRELKPLCAACLAEQERLAAEAAKVLGTGLAIAGGAFGLTGLLMVVVPVLLCLGGGAVLAAVSFFMERR